MFPVKGYESFAQCSQKIMIENCKILKEHLGERYSFNEDVQGFCFLKLMKPREFLSNDINF